MHVLDRERKLARVERELAAKLGREPNDEERAFWSRRLLQSGDVQGTVEAFLKSPEYAAKNKNDRDAITDLYQAFFGRTPSAEEIQVWEQRIARR